MEVRVRFRCFNQAICGELAEFISRYRGVRSSQIAYEVRGDVLEVSIFGSPNEVVNTKKAMKRAYDEWRRFVEFRSGKLGGLDVGTLSRITGRPVVPEVLVALLRSRGYSAELSGGELVTNAPPDLVVDLSSDVSLKLEEVSREYPKASRSLKYLLAALSVLGYGVEEVLQYLKQRGLVEENRRLKLLRNWCDLLAALRTVGVGASGSEDRDQEGR
ncbi:MAG: DUF2067 family protein [Sulfolobales archaeon]|nr:DUF2067 domain-containing protein [Sulfolobales archaeon]MDW8010362.1 DUF2067 family protein [Sulfolobales archaeon]